MLHFVIDVSQAFYLNKLFSVHLSIFIKNSLKDDLCFISFLYRITFHFCMFRTSTDHHNNLISTSWSEAEVLLGCCLLYYNHILCNILFQTPEEDF